MTEDRDLTDKHLREQMVAPGDQVCAIGRWSAAKHGLIPPPGGVIRLLQGDPQKIVGGLWRKCIGSVIGGLIVAAAVNGAIYTLLQVAAGKSKLFADTPVATHSIHRDEMVEAVSAGNPAAAEKLFANGTGVNVRDSSGRTVLGVAQDGAMARWLIAHGADVNAADGDGQTVLMQQAGAGRTEVVRALVNAGAKLDTLSTKWHSTALTQAASLFKSFDDVDFKLWKSSRPVHPKLIRGYATEDAATVEIRGQVSTGTYETWTYQLVHDSENWRVKNERWETRLSGREP
jgi:hypothetical protein